MGSKQERYRGMEEISERERERGGGGGGRPVDKELQRLLDYLGLVTGKVPNCQGW